MRIVDLLDKRSIELNGSPANKEEAIRQLTHLMDQSGKIADLEVYTKGVFAREEESTTGIGEGLAIPHCKSDSVKEPGLAAMVIPNGVDYDSLDGAPVTLAFLIAAPNSKDNVHLDVLSKLSVLMLDEDFTAKLRQAKTVDEFLKIIDDTERMKDEEEGKQNMTSEATFVVAVTSCPTGIAHTFMAAESLEKAAKAANVEIKVETRGQGGAKNVLTDAEIERATCVIVAADTKVPMDRFDGKKVIQVKVADGISKAEELVKKAASGEANVFKAANAVKKTESESKDSVGHTVYKHLMNGVTHMLPFVVGGGILIAIAFLIDGFAVDLNSVDYAIKQNFGSITPTAAFFKTVGGYAFNVMLAVLAGYIAESIADRPGLAPGFVGGLLAANGTSGFLGALVAGFFAGYVVKFLVKCFAKLPDSLEGIKSVLLYPLCSIFIVGLGMTFVVEPPIGWLNTTINTSLSSLNGVSSVILGILVAGMMAVDMGGPINKASYVFGTASIAAGNYNIMAAVMIGGMVPPIAIAIATLLFKNKFTAEERKAGPTNFIMGLSFITEGAIPFAAADPLRVLPSCIVGSALAGAISMACNCTLMAPHGGIFVFPVVGNAILYLVALAVGSIVGALILGFLKKPVEQ